MTGWECDGKIVTIAVRVDALEAALNCLSACADDEREPERYRSWFNSAYTQIKAESAHLMPWTNEETTDEA